MALEEIALQLDEGKLPSRVSALIEEAERRLDHLFETNRNRRVPRFLPSDPVLLYRVLRFLTEEDLPTGRTFCEWGSGFGVGACLASLLWVGYLYTLAFSDGNAFLGDMQHLVLNGVAGFDGRDFPETVFVMFQMAFAIIALILLWKSHK